MSPLTNAALSVACAVSCVALVGCDGWPRYLYEGLETEGAVESRLVTFENEGLQGDVIQHAGDVSAGTELVFFGYLDSCGYDEDADDPGWPEHAWDEDGDGVPDDQVTYHSGWFTGDVDWFGFTLVQDASLQGSLAWDMRPPGDTNAPYDEHDLEGAWTQESNLDLVLFEVEGTARMLIDETAVSDGYPEALAAPVRLPAGSRVAFAVGCRYALATDYEVVLTAL